MPNNPGRVLVVDDDPAICVVVSEALRRQGHMVEIAGSIADRGRLLAAFKPEVLLTDVMLPDGDGLDDVSALMAKDPELRVIVLSAQNTLNTAVRATEHGAFDYLPKPFDLNELTRAVHEAIGMRRRDRDEAPPPSAVGEDIPLVGRSAPMQEVYRIIARVVSNDLSILVLGESGTGKELVARAIHDLGPRRNAPFIAINMAAIPRELIEAELFGYEKGAFTGAHARTAGKFEQAQGGTLFLDEIGDMPMDAQTRLLRVLQTGEVTPVGGSGTIRVNVRIVAATHKDLQALIAEGRFRDDLYYRLNVVPIALPALRDRRDDIPLLARHFLERAAKEGLPRKTLSEAAARLLTRHSWPGNVRELQNLMQRICVLGRDDVIGEALLRQNIPNLSDVQDDVSHGATDLAGAARIWAREQLAAQSPDDVRNLHDALLDIVEPALLVELLGALDGNQIRAAQMLGINRNTLRKKLNDHGIDPARLRRLD